MAKFLVVDAEGLNVREKPRDGDVIAQLSYGHSVEQLRKRGSWTEIKTTLEGQPLEGYVANRYLRDPDQGLGFRLPTFGKPSISLKNLTQFATRASDDVLKAFDDQLDDILGEFQINKNARRLSHFLAQLSHESMGFTVVEENLNYSGDGLWRVFRRHFRSRDEAEQFARQPEKIANRVYANRIGNGSEQSGDGFRYRGRGFIQLTGKANYAEYGRILGLDLVDRPELAAETGNALRIAAAYWDQNGLNKLADRNDLRAITRKINGGLNGLEDRINEFKKAAAVWAAPFVGNDGKPKNENSRRVAAGGTAVGGGGAAGTSGVDIYESEDTEEVQDIDDVLIEAAEGVGIEVDRDTSTGEDTDTVEGAGAVDASDSDIVDETADGEGEAPPAEEAPAEEAAQPPETPVEEPALEESPAISEEVGAPADAPEETASDAEPSPEEPVDAPTPEEAPVVEEPAVEEPAVEASVEAAEPAPVEEVATEDLPADEPAEVAEDASTAPEISEPVEDATPEEPATDAPAEPVVSEEETPEAAAPAVEDVPEQAAEAVTEPDSPTDVPSEGPDFSTGEPIDAPSELPEDVEAPVIPEEVQEAVETVTTGAIEHAMDEENRLELSTFVLAVIVVLCALYLLFSRFGR